MRKLNITLLILITFIAFTAASVWEGTATASIGDEFPDTGYYAATNSYPKNTVVDITNLENGRTLRVIVLSNLENPGLLVVLSRDAASALGINQRSIGRVRMNQPSDAIAYSRFIGGYGIGDPDHDPLALLAATTPNPALFTEESWSALLIEQTMEELNVFEPVEIAEAMETLELLEEVEITEAMETLELLEEVEIAEAVETLELLEEVEIAEAVETLELLEEVEIAEAVETLELLEEVEIAEAVELADTSNPLDSSPHDFYSRLDEYEFVIMPDFERLPPDYIYFIIDPSEIVDTWELPDETEQQPDLSMFVEPTVTPEPFVEVPQEYIIPESLVELPQEYIIPETLVEAPQEIIAPESYTETLLQPEFILPEIATPQATPVNGFSVPVISNLESGMYYIQIGAYSRIDSVETELDRHSSVYPMVVQEAGTPANPLYRVLVGPLNLGESGAMLHRFRGTYSDAFVRQGQ